MSVSLLRTALSRSTRPSHPKALASSPPLVSHHLQNRSIIILRDHVVCLFDITSIPIYQVLTSLLLCCPRPCRSTSVARLPPVQGAQVMSLATQMATHPSSWIWRLPRRLEGRAMDIIRSSCSQWLIAVSFSSSVLEIEPQV